MTTYRYINGGQSKFEFEYLGEIETKREDIFGYKSWAQVGVDGIKTEVENLVLLSL
jgi:hypothetical protein